MAFPWQLSAWKGFKGARSSIKHRLNGFGFGHFLRHGQVPSAMRSIRRSQLSALKTSYSMAITAPALSRRGRDDHP